MKKRIWKRLLVFILAVTMVAGVFPGTGMSAEAEYTPAGLTKPYVLYVKDGSLAIKDLYDFFIVKIGLLNGTQPGGGWFKDSYKTEYKGTTLTDSDATVISYTSGDSYSVLHRYNNGWSGYNSGTEHEFTPKTYYALAVSVEKPNDVTVTADQIQITPSGSSTSYTTQSDIITSNSTLDVLLEDLGTTGATIKVPVVPKMAVTVSLNGKPIAIDQEYGTGTITSSNLTTSGTLAVTYQEKTYHTITPTSNITEGVSFVAKDTTDSADIKTLEPITPESGRPYYEIETLSNMTLEATAPDGYEFVRWRVLNSDGSKTGISNSNPLNLESVAANATYEAVFEPIDSAYVAKNITDDISYTEYELPIAFEQASTGDTIVLFGNATLSENISIPNGITFLLPYSTDESTWTVYGADNEYHPYANIAHKEYVNGFSKPGVDSTVILNVTNNAKITVESGGVLVTGGVIHSTNCATSGQTGGAHSDIIFEQGSSLDVKGVVSSSGFISGGNVRVYSGATLYQPFIIADFKGGTYTVAATKNDNVAILPFSEYAMQNVQSDIRVDCGAFIKGYADLYTDAKLDGKIPAAHNRTYMTIIGTNEGLIRLNNADSYMTINYDKETSVNLSGARNNILRANINMYGDASFDDSTLELTVSGVSNTINTKDYYFSLPYNYNLTLYSGTYDANAYYKLLPGATVTVASSATLNINGGLVVYDMLGNNTYSTIAYPTGSQLAAAGLEEVGSLIVNGTMNIHGTYAGKLQATYDGTGLADPVINVKSTATLGKSDNVEGVITGTGYEVWLVFTTLEVDATESNQSIYNLKAECWNGSEWEEMSNQKTDADGNTVAYDNTYYYVNSNSIDDRITGVTYDSATGQNTSLSKVTTNYAEAVERTGTWVDPKISFECDCEEAHNPITVEPGTILTSADIPNCPGKDGYSLDGWYAEKDGEKVLYIDKDNEGTLYFTDKASPMPMESVTLYPKLTLIEYPITLSVNGGRLADSIEGWTYIESEGTYTGQTYTIKGAFVLPNPTKEGYTFKGWTDAKGDVEKTADNTAWQIKEGVFGEKILNATWEVNSYKVIFEVDRTTYAELDVPYGTKLDGSYSLTGVANPSKLGNVFLGWYTSTEKDEKQCFVGTNQEDAVTVPVNGLTLYAKFEPMTYDVVFAGNGANSSEVVTFADVPYGGSITIPYNPYTKDYYYFTGWKDTNANIYVEGQTYAIADIVSADVSVDKITINAQWSNEYTIIYDANYEGGSKTTQTVNYDGDPLQLAENTYTRNGYSFLGWAYNSNATEAQLVEVIEDDGSITLPTISDIETVSSNAQVTLYAVWKANPYVAILYANDGTDASTSVDMTYGQPYGELPTLTKTGYHFRGWYTASEGGNKIESTTVYTTIGNIALYAHWEPYTYYVEYNANGGSGDAMEPSTLIYGEDNTLRVNTYTRKGYTFVGWSTDAEATEAMYAETVDADDKVQGAVVEDDLTADDETTVTLYAVWTANPYTIQFVAPDATSGSVADINAVYDQSVIMPANGFTREGYHFVGWKEPNGTTVYLPGEEIPSPNFATGTVEDQKATLIAVWEANTYYVEYDANDGTGTTMDATTLTYDQDQQLNKNTYTREGYTFLGWSEDKDSTTAKYVETTNGAEVVAPTVKNLTTEDKATVTLYAVWEANTYYVKYDANGGTGTAMLNSTLTYGTDNTLSVNTYTREGYTFLGWSIDAEATEAMYVESVDEDDNVQGAVVEDDLTANDEVIVTLYAIWSANPYTFTFDPNNGEEAFEVTQAYGSSMAAPTEPTKEGHSFAGWFEPEDTDYTKEYFAKENGVAQDELVPAKNVSLVAKWDVNEYTVSFVDGDTTITRQVAYGIRLDNDAYSTLTISEPTKSGYTFDGWFVGEGDSATEYFVEECTVTMPASEVTVTARYTVNDYAISLNPAGGTIAGDVWTDADQDGKYTGGKYNVETTVTLPVPTRLGYTFDGWTGAGVTEVTGENDEKAWQIAPGHTGDVTLTATWTPISYTAILNPNGGAYTSDTWVDNSKTFDIEDADIVLPELTKEGYTFDGWFEGNTKVTSIAPADVIANLSGTTYELTAHWTINQYTITFDSDGGNEVLPITKDYGTEISAPTAPTKEGYTFTGWKNASDATDTKIYFADEGGSVATERMPEGGLALVATWSINSYDIILMSDNQSFATITGIDYATTLDKAFFDGLSNSAKPATPMKTGYTFLGWYDGTGNDAAAYFTENGTKTMPDGNVTLYAKFQPNTYTIHFNKNGADGNETMASIGATFDKDVTLPQNAFTYTGYHFVGWKELGGTTTYLPDVEITAPNFATGDAEDKEATLLAQWEPNTYYVKYDANGGTGEMDNSSLVYNNANGVLRVNTFTRDGYTFAGWSTDKDATGATYTEKVVDGEKQGAAISDNLTAVNGGTATLYAIWIPIEYTISYDLNYPGAEELAETTTVLYDGKFTTLLAAQERTGYSFAGWYTAEEGGTEVLVNETVYTTPENSTLYAHWKANTYDITLHYGYDLPNSSSEKTEVIAVTYDQLYGYNNTFAEASRSGYQFGGWYTEPDTGSEPVTAIRITPETKVELTTSITQIPTDLYAYWSATAYTISYQGLERGEYASDVTNENLLVKGYNVTDLPLTLVNAIRPGYTFTGWTLNADGASTTPEESYVIPEDTTGHLAFTAHWSVNSYDIVLDANNGTISSSGWTAGEGDTYTGKTYTIEAASEILPTPVREGYTFTGWSGDAVEKTDDGWRIKAGSTEEQTAVAQWKANTYPVTLHYSYVPTDATEERVDTITVTYDKTYAYGTNNNGLPAQLYREGYLFDGWFTEASEGTEVEPGATVKITEAQELYAHWTPITYYVKYNANDGTGSQMAVSTFEYDKAAALSVNTYTREGYTFLGWAENSDATAPTYTESVDPDTDMLVGETVNNLASTHLSNVDLYAVWKLDSYSVTYEGLDVEGITNSEALATNPDSYTVEDTATSIINPVRTGYTFDGWTEEGDSSEDASTDVSVGGGNTGAITYVANWTANKYNVTLNAGEGTVSGADATTTITVTYDSAYGELPTPVRVGYKFLGWFYAKQDNGQVATYSVLRSTSTAVTAETTVKVAEDDTLYAHWTEIPYTVNLDVNDGTLSDGGWTSKTFYITDDAFALPVVTKEGHSFAGWNGDSTLTSISPETLIPTMADTTLNLEAHWTINQYTMTFDSNGGTVVDPITKDYATEISAPAEPTKTGYLFAGWFDADGTEYFAKENGTATKVILPAKNVALTAKWNPITYTVTYNANGGSGTMADSSLVYNSENGVLNVNAFTRDGYTFAGWATNPNATEATYTETIENGVVKGAVVTDNLTTTNGAKVTLYAIWTPNQYTIRYNLNYDGAEAITTTTSVTYGKQFEELLEAPTREGYTFTGWYTADKNGTKVELHTTVYQTADDSTLYAYWTVNQYTMTFDSNGGTDVASITKDYADEVVAPTEPTRVGYTFAGWFDADGREYFAKTDGIAAQERMPVNGLQLKAKWTINKHNITLVSEGATFDTIEKVAFATTLNQTFFDGLNAETKPDTPTKVGYSFVGWYTSTDENAEQYFTSTCDSTMPDAAITLYARFEANPYTIAFDKGSADGTETMAPISAVYDANVTMPKNLFAKTGYHFVEWATADKSKVFEAETTYEKPNLATGTGSDTTATLYAQWEPNTYYVKYDANGGAGSMENSSFIYDATGSLRVNTFTKAGYTFAGWATDKNATEPTYKETIVNEITEGAVVDDNLTTENGGTVTLYAVWTPNQYKVYYDLNYDGAPVVEDTTAVTYKSEYPELLAPTRVGYTFEGWYTATENGDKVVAGTTTYETVGDTILYANWVAKEYTVTFKSQNVDYHTETVACDSAIPEPAKPTREGYTFAYWYALDSNNNQIKYFVEGGETIMPARRLTLYAAWTANSYTVSFEPNGGSGEQMAPQTFTYNTEQVLTANAYTKEGYAFAGWKAEDGTIYANKQAVKNLTAEANGTVELTAQWEIQDFTVTLQLYDGLGIYNFESGNGWNAGYVAGKYLASYTANYATDIPLPSTPTRTGYDFAGWFDAYDNQYFELVDGVAVTETIPAVDTNLYARWTLKDCVISFANLDGCTSYPQPIEGKYGSEVTAPADPVKEGYSFEGWYTTSTFDTNTKFEFDEDTTMPENITLYAKWTINAYNVNFVDLDNSILTGISYTDEYNSVVTMPEDTYKPTQKGYIFSHWSLTKGGEAIDANAEIRIPTDDLNIYAVYISYLDLLKAVDSTDGNIDFAGTVDGKSELDIAREYYMLLNDAQKAQYEGADHQIALWAKIKEVSVNKLRQSVVAAQGVTNETLENVKVTDADGNTQYINLAKMKVFDEGLVANPPVIEGMIIEDQYYAINMLNVEFMTALFAYDEIVSIVCDDDLEPDATPKEHELTGATIESAGTLGSDQFNIMLIMSWAALQPQATYNEFYDYLYGQMNTLRLDALDGTSLWMTAKAETQEGVTYDVTYRVDFYSETHNLTYTDAGDNAEDYAANAKYETVVTLPTPVKRGYTFTGWTTDNQDITLTNTEGVYSFTMGRTDVSLAAHWEVQPYTVSLDMGDGSLIGALDSTWATDAQTAMRTQGYTVETEELTLPTGNQVVAPTGYTFGGWYLQGADASNPDNVSGSVVLNPKTDEELVLQNYTYVAKWIPIEYAMTVYLVDGSLAEGAQLPDGWNAGVSSTNSYVRTFTVESTDIVLPTVERYGYEFAGWYTTDTYADGTQFTLQAGETLAAGNVNLYAKWTPKQISVTLYRNDETTDYTTTTVTFGTTFGNLPTPAERDGYGFDGWFTEAENGTKYDANVSVTSTDPVTLYAHWTAGSFNINYEGLDFAGVDDATNHADNPSSYVVDTEVELKAPTRTGYTFAGWTGDNVETVTTQDGTKYYLKDGITGNQTVAATWTINQYTLTFIDPMDNDNVLYTIKQDYRSAVTTPPIPTKEGYTFVSWDKTVPSTMPAESIVYKASWAINSHSITFIDYNGNTQAVDTYDFGDTMTVRTAAAVEGYRFVGWFATEGTEKVQYFADAANPETMPDHDIVVRAEYQINQYTFTFDTDTEGQVVIDAVTKDFGATVTAPTEPTKIGHTFAGWYNVDTTDTKEYFAKDDAGHAQAETVPAKNISLKAKWTVNSYTITFVDPMDVDPEGNGKVLYTITNKYGEALTMPAAPTKAGYLFAGWDGTFPSTMPAENLTLNATWNAIQYSVTFNGNGATAESVPADMTNLSYNVTYSLPTEVPVRTGYTFAGWKTAGGEAALGDITNLSASNNAKVTLYAMWTANTYTVTLDANGGTLDQATMVVTYDKKYEGLPTPVRTGYSFNGWFDGTTNITADTDVKITQNQTLVAQWTEKGDTPYTVVHYLQDLEGISYTKDKEVSYTGKTNATATATAESYTGYALNTVKSSLTGTIAADGSLVLVAYYDRIPYTVTWNVANTTVQETYPFGATPDYTGEKDYADDHASYTFTGWDKAISAVTGDVTYTAQYESSYEASIGEVTYATLEKALSMAVAGETVYLEKDVTLTSDITVPTGVDLLIPCMDDDFGYQYVDDGKLRFNHDGTDLSGVQGLGPNAYMYRRLTVPEGVTVTINGNILINSVSGRPSGGNYEMDITGGYAQIDLAGDIVVADGGNLDCYGYVKGNGTVRAKSGSSVGDLYVVRNWRGGSQALEMYQSFITYGTEDERQTYPMNEYDCHNIETDIIIEHGASYDGNVKMNANAGEGNAYYYTRFPQVNVNNGLIRLTDEDGYVVRSYDATTGIETFTLYGGADFAESSLTIMGRDLSTKDFVYPIDGDIGFVLKDGDYHFKNDWKFLTGEGMTVCNGATLNVDYRTYVAFYDEFDDVDNSGNTEYPDRQAAILRIEEGAKFINGGTFGGNIVTESPDILIGDYPTWGITTLEANGYCNGVVRLEHPLNITREGYSWRYGDPELGEVENSIIWYGADYTALIAAVKSVPKDLDIYSDATADPLEAVLDAIVYDLGKDKQAQVDTWTEQVTQYVATLELRVVNVVLDPAGGTVSPASIQITYGGTYAELPTPTYYGYNFLGWFDADNVQIQATDTMKLTVNETTLTAHWEKIPADYSKVNEAINAIPADMTGYTESSVQAVYDAEDAVDMTLGLADQAKVDAMAQAILDAIDALEYVQITVSFDANGGVAITDTFTLRYKDAYPYDSLPVPVRDGYDFVGWYTAKEGGTQIKADTYVTSVEDVTLYAKWTDSSSDEPADYSAVTAAIAKIPADATPYTAASWNKLEEAKNAVVYDLTVDRQDDVNAWAKAIEDAITALEYKTITVYFDPVDGTCATGNIKVTYGTAPGSLPEATRTYYEFLGWYTDKTGGDKVTGAYLATKTENVTVYAQYQILPADYSQIEALKAQIPGDLSCYSDETVAALNTALAQIETGYTADKQTIVDRWATELQTALDNLTYRSMTLTYEPQGGRVTPKTLTVTYGDVLAEMPTPDRSNHVFDGWYTEAVGGTKVEAGYKITHVEDFSLYAHWIQVDADYSEIYEEIEKIPEDVEVYYTEASVANLQAALDAVVYGLDAGHQSQINQWASDINVARLKLQGKSVKVTFSYNGGTTDTSYKNVRYSNTYGTLPTTTKSGYEFEGWYTAKTGGTLVTSSTKMMQITNHTLYAHWKSTAVEPPVVEPPVVTPPAVVGPTCTKDHIDPNCSSRHFADIDQTTAWYHLNVDYVVANGIMNGIAVAPGQAAQFAPDLTTTRGMIVTILYRMSGDTVTAVEKAACPFVDVPDGIYYEDAVAWAYANGVVQGISNDLFAPENEITREQMILMLHRFAGYLGEDTSAYKSVSSFVDAGSVSSWSSQAVAWGYAEGLLTGIPDANGQLQITPQGAIPRCQAAAFIHRFCEKFK